MILCRWVAGMKECLPSIASYLFDLEILKFYCAAEICQFRFASSLYKQSSAEVSRAVSCREENLGSQQSRNWNILLVPRESARGKPRSSLSNWFVRWSIELGFVFSPVK